MCLYLLGRNKFQMKTLLLDCSSLQFLKSDWSGTWLLLPIDTTYHGFYCVCRLFTYAMTITALQSISTWKTGCLNYTWMHSSNENYDSWKTRALGHSCLVSACKCIALTTVNSCSIFQPYRIEDRSVSGKWLQCWIKYLGTRVICVPNGKRVLVSELCLIICDCGA